MAQKRDGTQNGAAPKRANHCAWHTACCERSMETQSAHPSVLERTTRTLALGAGAGIAATLAMTGLMYGAQQLGLLGRAPPRRIVEHALSRLGLRKKLPPSARWGLAAIAHLGFGASQGALYALLQDFAGRRVAALTKPTVSSGVPFALAVWAASYAGWIPALDILPKPRNDRPGRPTSMVLAHIVYGATLSHVLRRSRALRANSRRTP